MDADGVRDAMQSSRSRCRTFINDGYSISARVSRTARSRPDQAVRLERDVKIYVRDLVALQLADRDVLTLDWKSDEVGSLTAEEVYEQAYCTPWREVNSDALARLTHKLVMADDLLPTSRRRATLPIAIDKPGART